MSHPKANQATTFPSKYAVLTAAEMIRAEVAAFKSGIPAYALMAKAGGGLAKAILSKKKTDKILFLNGPGNNGGDSWVAAEILRRKGWQVLCAALKLPDGHSCAALEAYEKWQGETGEFPENLDEFDVIVDALFGTGLERPVEGRAAEWIKAANESDALRVAVDIPSGISSDTGQVLGTAFRADLTTTFSHKKRGHLLMPGLELSGEVEVVDIGIGEEALGGMALKVFENNPALWRDDFPKLTKGGHKHQRGHLLVVGGPLGMSGAARMAARSALRTGAGLVTTLVPEKALLAYAEKQFSVMSAGYRDEKEFAGLVASDKFSAFVIGPGNGVGEGTRARVLKVLATAKPCVLDADALTSFEGNAGALEAALHEQCVLTPHMGEFKRLWPDLSWDDKVATAETAAAKTGAVVLLKGPDTVISDGTITIINTHAAPQLATAGSGDVLAGIIAGLMTQGMAPFLAAAAGAWLHGEAALIFGGGLIADDLIETLPKVLKDFP
ncbi:MAG: NAD(P)H-hydrate dehydratase [Proteobacteria bacterium]|nr:NAD(P)H-hydrate dehydratase [Pseudomonadota bacterium]